MKKILILLLIFLTSCAAPKKCCGQTDSLSLYKKGYVAAKELNTQFKLKINHNEILIKELESQVKDLIEIQTTHESIMRLDSMQLNMRSDQIRLLNDNLDIYQKEFNRRGKFWNKPWFGAVLGAVGTIAIIHVIDYSLPE